MPKQNINNALKLYNANYYSEPVLDEKLLQFHNELDDYINKIKIANYNNENEEHIKNIVAQNSPMGICCLYFCFFIFLFHLPFWDNIVIIPLLWYNFSAYNLEFYAPPGYFWGGL